MYRGRTAALTFCKNVVVYFNITTCYCRDDVIGAQGGRGREGGACVGMAWGRGMTWGRGLCGRGLCGRGLGGHVAAGLNKGADQMTLK